MLRSLASRFFVASLIILPILLILFALSLAAAFRSSLISGEEERLNTHAYFLLSAANFIDQDLFLPRSLRDERFNQINSGLYGFIYNSAGHELWRSQSAQLLEIEAPSSIIVNQGQTSFYTTEINDRAMFAYSYDVVWELENNQEQFLRLLVLHDQAEAQAEQKAYRNQLWQSLSAIGVLILVSQMAILRWGLSPLKKLAKDLVSVESGEAKALEGNYPTEIQAVTENLNQVLASERNQRQRYRNTLDDLAHSLKTPLSVIKGSLQQSDSQHIIGEQVERMNQIISHQLQRAVVANPGVPGKAIAIKPLAERLLSSISKVYREKNITTQITIDESIQFKGDERDLLEVLGNLIENAFKYCHRAVRVGSARGKNSIDIIIEDDGNGVAADARQTILRRGARADSATSGQGIGLAVAVDILSSYKGSLQIDESTMGGAKFIVSFPI